MTAAARVTAWLDRLEGLHTAALTVRNNYPSLPKLTALHDDDADRVIGVWSDGATSDFAETFDPDSADLIVGAVNALPALLALARGVTTLAEELDDEADQWEDQGAENHRQGFITTGDAQRENADRQRAFTDLLRRLLADAAPDTGEETA